jgi:hypothetical protein
MTPRTFFVMVVAEFLPGIFVVNGLVMIHDV